MYKTIWAIAWPLIIANSFWNLQLTIDRIFLGGFSTEALGAAMAVMGVFWVPMALLQQTAAYVTTFVAQFYGANKEHKIASSLWQSIYISIIGGILFFALNFFSKPFFEFVGHADNIRDLEIIYYNALSFTALPTALVAAISGFFTGLGLSKQVIGINLTGLLFNVLFDYCLISGNLGFDAYGIAGAGYATALATYCAVIYGVYLLLTHKKIKAYNLFQSIKLDWKLMKKFVRYGIPSGFQWALEGLAFTVFLIMMGNLKNGDVALSSSSISVTIMLLAVLPAMGVAQAVLTLVGQKMGEKKPEQAQEYTWGGVQISFVYIFTVALSFIVFPDFYLSWFKNEANPILWTQVSTVVPKLLMLVAGFTILDSMYLNISFALKGAGDTRFVSLMALIIPWPFMVLPAYMLRHHANALILSWLSVLVYVLVINLILFFRFRQGHWKSIDMVH